MTIEQWRARGGGKHPFFALPNVTHHNVEPDELHVLYLGVCMYMLGSVLWLLSYKKLHETPQRNLERVWRAIEEIYALDAVTCQYSNVHLSMFHDPKRPRSEYPKLKGRGGEVKALEAVTCEVWAQWVGEGSTRARRSCNSCDVKAMCSPLSTSTRASCSCPREALRLRTSVYD